MSEQTQAQAHKAIDDVVDALRLQGVEESGCERNHRRSHPCARKLSMIPAMNTPLMISTKMIVLRRIAAGQLLPLR